MSRKQVCPICSRSDVEVHTETLTHKTSDGDEIAYEAEYSRCLNCGEEFVTRDQSRAATRVVVGIERQRAGRLAPNEILAIREAYGATQEQMETILNLGKKTWPRLPESRCGSIAARGPRFAYDVPAIR
jgi:putative zinc finger/helix-turn-helix YgiT family protein